MDSVHLSMPYSERRLALVGLDLLAVCVALYLVMELRADQATGWELIRRHPSWFILLATIWLPLAHAFDVYNLRTAARMFTSAAAVTRPALLTALIYSLIPFVTPALPHRRLELVALPLLLTALLVAGRGLYVLVLGQPQFGRRALIIGADWAGQTIAEALAVQGDGVYQVVGFVDDDPSKQGRSYDISKSALTVLGDRRSVVGLVSEHRVTTLVPAIAEALDGDLIQILTDCLEHGVEIVPMPVLYEQITGRVPVKHIGNNWHVAVPIHHPGTGNLWPLAKRVMDIGLSSVGLVCLGIVTPLIALAIYLDSPGSIFYTQERVGKGGRRFRVCKFRTMITNAENGQARWADRNDARATRVGRILRRAHIDEFPQFLNVLMGEMSAVGPRPERPEFVEELAREIPFYRVRHAVKPGMAGWGLVKQGYGASVEDALIKLQYDLYYIKHQSVWLDIVILLRAFGNALTLRGR